MDIGSLLLVAHVIGGFSSLTLGILIAILPKKGNKLHKKMGHIYFYGMTTVFVSAVLLVSFIKWNAFLFAIAVFSFYLCYSGFRAIRLRKQKGPALIDWIVAGLAITVGIGLFIYGLLIFYQVQSFHVLGLLCLIFGFFTAFSAIQDVHTKMSPHKSKDWWLRQHISGMMGSLIAATTAFSVQNLNFLIPGQNMDWLLWLLPTVIGTPFISVQIANLKGKGLKKKAA